MDFLYRNGRSRSSVATWFAAYLAVLPLIGNAGPMDMDGQFAVSQTGAATYTIPLQIPPGAGGVEPQLALTYNSQSGNGLLGVGWSLSGLSTITRCPRTMAQDGVRGGVNFDANDRYCLDGQRLMVVSGTDGADGAEYRTEREGFSKIVSYGSAGNGPAWFKVWTKAGQILEYGNTADSRIEAVKASGSMITWPTGTVRVWAQNQVKDTKGNYYTVTYTEDATNGDYYPQRIDYTGNRDTGLSTSNSVQFEYETKNNSTSHYEAGALVRQTLHLKYIRTYVNSLPMFVKVYSYGYDIDTLLGYSRVVSVAECDDSNICLKNIRFAWQTLTQASLNFLGVGTATWYSNNGGTASSTLTGDFNGDGKTDMMVSVGGGNWNVCLSTGSGFSCATWYSNNGGTASSTLTGDFNGDGKTDMMVSVGGGNWNVCLSTGSGFSCSTWYSNNGGTASSTLTGDFNGDGKTDMMVSIGGGNWNVCLSTGSGFSCSTWYSNNGGTASSTLTGDFNGDGKTDMMVSIGGGNWNVCLSTGSGFSCSTWYSNNGGTASSTLTGDFNGDGKTDMMVSVGGGNWNVCLSTGSGFSCTTWYSNNGADFAKTVVGDFNGDGKTDMTVSVGGSAWNVSLSAGDRFQSFTCGSINGSDKSRTLFGDFNGDGKTDMMVPIGSGGWNVSLSGGPVVNVLASITDVLGEPANAVLVTYKPLTDNALYAKSTSSTYPLLDIQAPLYVVSSVSESNGLGGVLTTTYTYGGLKAEVGTGRGLLGFNWIENQQVESGVVTRTTYRQDWPYVGLPSQVKSSLAGSGNNGLLRQIDLSYSCLDPKTGAACSVAAGNRYVPYASQKVESGWDLNGAALPVTTSTQQIDAFGNPIEETVSSSDGYGKTITNSYVNDTAKWFIGQRQRSQVQSVSP
ncbi:MAG: FG-GAP-like repeat-containing protein [Propionivibrio sp.]